LTVKADEAEPASSSSPSSAALQPSVGISPQRIVLKAANVNPSIVPTITPDNATCDYVYFTTSDESKISIDYEFCQSGQAFANFTKVSAFDGTVTLTAHSCTNPNLTADCLVSCGG